MAHSGKDQDRAQRPERSTEQRQKDFRSCVRRQIREYKNHLEHGLAGGGVHSNSSPLVLRNALLSAFHVARVSIHGGEPLAPGRAWQCMGTAIYRVFGVSSDRRVAVFRGPVLLALRDAVHSGAFEHPRDKLRLAIRGALSSDPNSGRWMAPHWQYISEALHGEATMLMAVLEERLKHNPDPRELSDLVGYLGAFKKLYVGAACQLASNVLDVAEQHYQPQYAVPLANLMAAFSRLSVSDRSLVYAHRAHSRLAALIRADAPHVFVPPLPWQYAAAAAEREAAIAEEAEEAEDAAAQADNTPMLVSDDDDDDDD